MEFEYFLFNLLQTPFDYARLHLVFRIRTTEIFHSVALYLIIFNICKFRHLKFFKSDSFAKMFESQLKGQRNICLITNISSKLSLHLYYCKNYNILISISCSKIFWGGIYVYIYIHTQNGLTVLS